MSVHKQPNGKFKVMWKQGTRQRSKTFDRKRDADLYDADVKRRKTLGPHLMAELDRSTMTLAEFVQAGFRSHAATLSDDTRRQYKWALDHHLAELLDVPLVTLDVPRLRRHQEDLLERGRTPNTVREAMTRLSGVLQVAVDDGLIPANPVRSLRKVPADPRPEVKPLTPVLLEALIALLDGRGRAIVLLGGHLGLRPLEIRQVPWSAFDGATLTVSRARTKRSAARTRVIDVPTVTARELRAWQLESGGRDADPIVGSDLDGPLGKDGLRLWAYKRLDPAARKATGRDDVTLYTLRHTHASLLHYAGFTVPEAADRMGHSTVVHWNHYAHIVRNLRGRRYDGLDALIDAARAERFPVGFPEAL
jgi:integrase